MVMQKMRGLEEKHDKLGSASGAWSATHGRQGVTRGGQDVNVKPRIQQTDKLLMLAEEAALAFLHMLWASRSERKSV